MLQTFSLEGPARAAEQPVQTAEASAGDCRARAQLYRLLGGVFAEEPGAEFLSALRAPEALRELEDAGLAFDADFTGASTDRLVETLAAEYASMFIAAGGFPPVESVRLTGRYYQEPNFAVKQAYREAGFEVGRGRFHVFEDHLAVELMFVAELLEHGASVLERSGVPGYRRIERDIKRFWALHLGRWVRGYAALVQRATEHSFYREMARLLASFAEDEIVRMRLRVDDVDGGREVVPKSEVQVLFNPDEPICNACVGEAPGTR
jgi:TorA maturation chaperone TorD